jgi:hypothetical protein
MPLDYRETAEGEEDWGEQKNIEEERNIRFTNGGRESNRPLDS